MTIVGIDLGGTFIKSGLVDREGRLVRSWQCPTAADRGPGAVLETVARAIARALEGAGGEAAGVGVATPGLVDGQGRVFEAPNLPGWDDLPLASILRERFRLPVRVENDASAFVMGEYVFGAGKPFRSIVGITLGTGVGGGAVINGRLARGGRYSAMEIGHLTINARGLRCKCGSIGCLERYVGSARLAAKAAAAARAGLSPALVELARGDFSSLTPEMISRAAAAGDPAALGIWREAGRDIGAALAGMVNLLNPEAIVIGGGVARAAEWLFPAIEETIGERSFRVLSRGLRILPASLGGESGILAAAALLFPGRAPETADARASRGAGRKKRKSGS